MRYPFLLLAPFLFAACDKSAPAKPDVPPAPAAGIPMYKAAYALCRQYGDLEAAAPLAYQLAASDTEGTGEWKEELVKIHFATRRFASCLKILDDLTAHHGGADKLPLLEMAALCHEGLGHKDEATAAWRQLWDKNHSALTAVRLAGLGFETGKLDEAQDLITAGLAATDAGTATLTLPKTRQEMQQIPVKAALHNLKALLILKRDPAAKDAARAELDAALALAPDFELAKRNLAGLSGPSATGKNEVPRRGPGSPDSTGDIDLLGAPGPVGEPGIPPAPASPPDSPRPLAPPGAPGKP